MSWDVHSDHFYFDFRELINYARSLLSTKRSVLKFESKIYDPLGWLTPFTVSIKIHFQQLCVQETDWDSELDTEMKIKYSKLISDLKHLDKILLRRALLRRDSKPLNV